MSVARVGVMLRRKRDGGGTVHPWELLDDIEARRWR